MNEQRSKIVKAGEGRTGGTRSPKRSQNLYALGQRLGIAKEDIKKTIRKKKLIQTYALIIVAAVATGFSYMLISSPLHYTGAGMKDFDFFAKMMYNAFGRIF